MIGALAEALGATGVIVTLVYLAAQIRAGTRATRRTNAHQINEGTRVFYSQISENEETASLWQRGLTDHKALTPVEALRFSTIMLSAVTLWEELFYAAKDQDLPAWAGTVFRFHRREVVSLPGFSRWYQERGHWLSQEFRESLESDMRAADIPPAAAHYAALLTDRRDS